MKLAEIPSVVLEKFYIINVKQLLTLELLFSQIYLFKNLYLEIVDGTWDCFGHFWNLCPVEVCLKSYRKKRVNVIEMQYTKELASMYFVHFNEHLLSSIRWSLIHRLCGKRRELFCCSSNCIASNLNVVCNAWNLHGIYMVN